MIPSGKRMAISFHSTVAGCTDDSYRELSLQIAFLGHQFVLLIVELGNGAGFGGQAVGQLGFLGCQLAVSGFQFLAGLLGSLQISQGLVGFLVKSLLPEKCDRFVTTAMLTQQLKEVGDGIGGEKRKKKKIKWAVLTASSSSTRVTLSRGLTFCHKRYHGQLRSCPYLRKLRWTTCRATLKVSKTKTSIKYHLIVNCLDASLPLVLELLVVLAGLVTADVRLHPGDDLGQAVVTELFKLTQGTGLEEDLETLPKTTQESQRLVVSRWTRARRRQQNGSQNKPNSSQLGSSTRIKRHGDRSYGIDEEDITMHIILLLFHLSIPLFSFSFHHFFLNLRSGKLLPVALTDQ